jgi:quinol monooxygenase YgiN
VSAAQIGEIVYEVNIDLDAAIEADYRDWLRGHVEEILALPGFIDARVFDVIDPPPAPGRITLCTQYRLRDAAALQDYFDQHAPRLRGDGIARFGGRFVATRRVLGPRD